MSNQDKAAVIEERLQMRTYWINMQCTARELAAEFGVTVDLASIQIARAKREAKL